jgi:hypothetical protein
VTRTAAALVAALACGACGKGDSAPTAGNGPGPSPTLAPLASVPTDHLGPDELVEGTERAFGLALPRGLLVEESLPYVVHASGPMSIHALTAYLRPRLDGGSLRESATVATFEHVRTPGMTADADLTIHLEVTVGKTRVDISQMTYPKAPELPDEAARWRQVGLTPQGKLLDPTHTE